MATSNIKQKLVEIHSSYSEDQCILKLLKPELKKPTLIRPKEQEIWLLSRLFPSQNQVKNENIIEMEDDLVLDNFIRNYET